MNKIPPDAKIIEENCLLIKPINIIKEVRSCSKNEAKRLFLQKGLRLIAIYQKKNVFDKKNYEEIIITDPLYTFHLDDIVRIGKEFAKLRVDFVYDKYETPDANYVHIRKV